MAPPGKGAALASAKRTHPQAQIEAGEALPQRANRRAVSADRTATAPTSDQRLRGETPRREIVNAILFWTGPVRLAAFAQVLPAVGNGLLALGPLEHRRHRRPVPRRAARRPETGTDGLDGGHRLPVATRREHRRRCSARVRRRKAHQWDQAPRRCGHLGLLLVVLVSLRPARKSATGGRRVLERLRSGHAQCGGGLRLHPRRLRRVPRALGPPRAESRDRDRAYAADQQGFAVLPRLGWNAH